ncbi:MAG: replication initiator protein [Microvirus sp.]|nr:MAG: replication initiator protein [Microvirus sp.]
MCRFSNFNKEGQLVRCGKCDQCYKSRAMEWYVRINYDLRHATSAYFVTLTYDDATITRTPNGYYTVVESDLRNYFKRLRKREKGNQSIKYYACSEYGTVGHRPHYHAIILNVNDERNLHKAWSIDGNYIGNVFVPDTGGVSDASIKYVTGYIGKRIGIPRSIDDDRQKEFSRMSKGIGLSFLNDAGKFHLANEQAHTVIDGTTFMLPRYLKEKLWAPTIEYTPRQLWSHYVYWLYSCYSPAEAKSWAKRVSVSDFKCVKTKNAILQKISKSYYEKFHQAKVNSMANFDSVNDWSLNSIDVADALNPGFQRSRKIKPG